MIGVGPASGIVDGWLFRFGGLMVPQGLCGGLGSGAIPTYRRP